MPDIKPNSDENSQPDKKNAFTNLFNKKEEQKGTIIDNIVEQQNKTEQKARQAEAAKKESATNKKAIFSLPSRKLAKNTNNKPKKHGFSSFLSGLLILGSIGTYGFFFFELDQKNTLHQIYGRQNTGEILAESRNEITRLQKTLADINRSINDLAANREIEEKVQLIKNITQTRTTWSELINEVRILKNEIDLYSDSIKIESFAGNNKDKSMTINGEAVNEKVFSLVANFIDIINKHNIFYGLEYKRYAKNKAERDSNDFRSNIQFKFNFRD